MEVERGVVLVGVTKTGGSVGVEEEDEVCWLRADKIKGTATAGSRDCEGL